MNVRIQTYGRPLLFYQLVSCLLLIIEGTTVYDALEKGFDDLMALCDVVTNKFTTARDAFDAK